MLLFDFALRCTAIGLLALTAFLLFRAPIDRNSKGAVALVAISTTALLILKSALPLNLPDWAMANLALIGGLEPLAITWLILAIFLDRPSHFGLWMLSGAVASAAMFGRLQLGLSPVICVPIALLHHGALMVLAVASARGDLVSNRCSARPYFAVAIAALAIVMVGMDALNGASDQTAPLALAVTQSVGTLAIVSAFAIWILRADMTRWPGQIEPRREAPTPHPTGPDTALINRLTTAMAEGIWREEGLTIGALAQRLSVPEHRLRRAINQGLGHRNFSSFINAARIGAAKDALADPEQTSKTVLEIAYDVGFASLGPFNRAFRSETGQAPTEYRREALEYGDAPAVTSADSEKSEAISGNLH